MAPDPFFDEEVYIDKERLAAGDLFNQELARATCKSFCMVVVYMPKYEKHPFCLQEFRAMEMLEENRMELAGKAFTPHRGMSIPIVYRMADELSDEIKKSVHYLDFSKYTTASPRIRKNPVYVEELKKLAEKIHQLYRLFENIDPCRSCHEFTLPDPSQVQPLRSAKLPAPPFPGSQSAV